MRLKVKAATAGGCITSVVVLTITGCSEDRPVSPVQQPSASNAGASADEESMDAVSANPKSALEAAGYTDVRRVDGGYLDRYNATIDGCQVDMLWNSVWQSWSATEPGGDEIRVITTDMEGKPPPSLAKIKSAARGRLPDC